MALLIYAALSFLSSSSMVYWFSDVPIALSHSHPAFTRSKMTFDRENDLVPNFQRNFCSNFVCICCYVRLPSLHDLYDHLEEAHIGPNGMRKWPPKVCSELSKLSGSPRATSPSKDLDSDYAPDESILAIAYSTRGTSSDVSPYEDTFHLDYFTTCDAENIPQCPPFRYPLAHNERSCPPPPSTIVASYSEASDRGQQEDKIEAGPQNRDRASSACPIRVRLRNRKRCTAISSSNRKATQSKISSSTESRTNTEVAVKSGYRKRISKKELVYNCLTPGCIKTYRNANGLKYHKEKGTCVISEEFFAANRVSLDHRTSTLSSSEKQGTSAPPRVSTSTLRSRPPMDRLTPPDSSSPSPVTPKDIPSHDLPLHKSLDFSQSDEMHSDEEISSRSVSSDEVSALYMEALTCDQRSHMRAESSLLRSSASPLSFRSRSLSPLSLLESLESPPVSPVGYHGLTRLGISTGHLETILPATVFAPEVSLNLDRASCCTNAGIAVLDDSEGALKAQTLSGDGVQLDDEAMNDELDCLDSVDGSNLKEGEEDGLDDPAEFFHFQF
ncbi:hypothetical protein GGU10DRAFT_436412 [Lentinula aff. detonsa]|uniref:C2H2-type domain-containing protein n=1 Tax=Lentinula aff. detonsa TaxID=2804958 RepID=A0AA38KD01_9AGAR|nr:hypothetical protein GGU10DRAFT_436412 [Lentinula aff. detonsa]